jgi:hypothetical protein
MVQHVVHPLLEGGLALLQRLLTLGQVSVGLVDHLLPSFEGLPLLVELVLKGEKLLLLEAQLLFMAANLCFPRSDPSLLQAQALRTGVSALLASVEQGLAVLGLF